MAKAGFFDFIRIDEYSSTPKYLQFKDSIIKGITEGRLIKDYLLPSINEISFHLDISRDTAEKAYRHLKMMGVINSVPGKGYYISNTDFRQQLKVLLMFNKLSVHKKIVYDAFVAALGEDVSIDFYIYNNDFKLFKRLLNEKKEDYSHYVIIPHFIDGGDNAYDLINKIPKDKLILLDKKPSQITGDYSAVYENFEKDIFGALEQAKKQLSKYHTIKLIFPESSYYPVEILTGFKRFCRQYNFRYNIISDVIQEPISEGEVYINLMEDDLVILLERIIGLKLKIGKDVGVISYNETPLKKILLKGITTISTNFSYMGATAASMVKEQGKRQVEIPFSYIQRSSL